MFIRSLVCSSLALVMSGRLLNTLDIHSSCTSFDQRARKSSDTAKYIRKLRSSAGWRTLASRKAVNDDIDSETYLLIISHQFRQNFPPL